MILMLLIAQMMMILRNESMKIKRIFRRDILEKWFPLQGERDHSSNFRRFKKQNREEGETEYKQQAYQFTQGYNILQTTSTPQTTSTSPNPNLYHTQ